MLITVCSYYLFLVMICFSLTQQDTDEFCAEQVGDCTACDYLWFKCPITCAKHLGVEGSWKKPRGDPEEFFHFHITKENGQEVEFEEFDGYVFLYAVIPLMPGVSQFYYEMLEHIHSIFPFTVQIFVLPYYVGKSGVSIKQHDKPKVVMLKEVEEPTPMMLYLNLGTNLDGNMEDKLYYDRVTMFLIEPEASLTERLISPTMPFLEQQIGEFVEGMGRKNSKDL